MAELFIKQAEQYAAVRPSYPPELFEFIASKTPVHDLAWDVGAGSGQAALPLAEIFKNVVATDTSAKQLEFAPKLPNIRYQQTPAVMSLPETERLVASKSTVDLVTIAQAMHWLDLPSFYSNVRHVLKKPHGAIAFWCYTLPEVNAALDEVLKWFYEVKCGPYWEEARRLVDDEYRSIEFPFEAVDGVDGMTGPFRFVAKREMDMEEYLTYLRSWSAYQTAKEKGLELLTAEVVDGFKRCWGGDGKEGKNVVRFMVYLRIGKVGTGV